MVLFSFMIVILNYYCKYRRSSRCEWNIFNSELVSQIVNCEHAYPLISALRLCQQQKFLIVIQMDKCFYRVIDNVKIVVHVEIIWSFRIKNLLINWPGSKIDTRIVYISINHRQMYYIVQTILILRVNQMERHANSCKYGWRCVYIRH